MKVNEFIEGFKANKVMNSKLDPTRVEDYIRTTLEVKEYVPFVEKQSVAQIVLTSCSHMKDGVISIDSIQRYMIFTITVLATYTNLEFNGDETDLESYDALCSYSVGDSTLLDMIIKTFEKEYVRCNDVLNMLSADLMVENNIEKQIGKFLSNLSDKFGSIADKVTDNMQDFVMDLDQLNIDKLSEIVSKLK